MIFQRIGREARRQHSSRDAKITAVYRGTCDVQLPSGQKLSRVHFASGIVWPIGTWVKIERVENDWQVIGIGSSFTEVYVAPTPEVPTIYAFWVQAYGNPGLTRSRISPAWESTEVEELLLELPGAFAAVPLGVIFGGGVLLTAQAERNEADTAYDALVLYVGDVTYTAAISTSPSFFVGYGDMWCNEDGDFVLVRLGPHLQQLYRLREGAFEELTLSSLGSRTLSGANMDLTGKFLLADVLRTYGSGGITLDFGGTPWPSPPVETVPTGTLVRQIQCWDTNTSLTTVAQSWAADPTIPTRFGLGNAYVLTGASAMLAIYSTSALGAYAFRKRPLPSEDGDYGLGVLWGWDETLPGGNWSGEKPTENNDCSRSLKAYLTSFLLASGAEVWKREIAVDLATLPVIEDAGILSPMTNFLQDLVVSPDVFGGVINEGEETNYTNGEGQLQPSTANFDLPYRRFVDRPQIVLFPSSRNDTTPVDVGDSISNLNVFYDWMPEAANGGEVVINAAGFAYWAYAHPVEFLSAVGAMHRDEAVVGVFQWPGLGNQPVSTTNEDLSYTTYHNPDFFPMIGRYVEKVSTSGALVWRADLTQRINGMAWYSTKSALGVPSADVIGGVAAGTHPLGDNIQWVRPCGRVVFVAADFHSLGPNFQPTLKLLVLSDANGALLHTIPLYLNANVLSSDINGSGFTDTTADGSTTQFFFNPGVEISEITELRIDGLVTTDYSLNISGAEFDVTFPDPPVDGAYIEIDYTTTEVIHRAGEYLYDVQSAEIRCGQTEGGLEFAVVFVTQVARDGSGNFPRTILVEMGSSISVAPTVSTYVKTWGSTSTLALSNGRLVDIVWDGSQWTIVAK